jgi:hypothetical protein
MTDDDKFANLKKSARQSFPPRGNSLKNPTAPGTSGAVVVSSEQFRSYYFDGVRGVVITPSAWSATDRFSKASPVYRRDNAAESYHFANLLSGNTSIPVLHRRAVDAN